jgi:pimeloyl-ACP methyl ester carboxylesterase
MNDLAGVSPARSAASAATTGVRPSSRLPDRTARIALAAALALATWRLIAHDAPLSILLLAAPPLGLALVPAAWRRWRTVIALAAVGAALPLLAARGLGDDRSVPAWWPLAVKAWCSAGVILLIAGAIGRARELPLLVRLPAWLAVAAVAAVLAGVLPKLYRHHQVLRAELWAEPLFAGAEHETLVTRDGVRLAITWLPGARADSSGSETDSGRGAGGILVLTHGVGGYPQQFRGMTALLRQRGWAVVHWGLRGHDHSSPAAVTYGPREAEDLVAVWEHIRASRARGRPMVAYGASMGGATLLLAAHRLAGCDAVLVESAYAEFAPLITGNLQPVIALAARAVAVAGLGLDPESIRPVDAPILRAGPPLFLAASAGDAVVPYPWHHQRLVAAAPRAVTLVNPTGQHLDAIYDPAWPGIVHGLLDEAEAYHRVHDGLGALAPAR